MFKHFGFYTAGVPFEGDSLETGALGGSETAFIQITRALACLGHRVTVFNNCSKPRNYHGVTYYTFKESLQELVLEEFDVFVVSRFFGFFTLPIKAGLKVLWNHDTLDQPKDLKVVQDEIDLFLLLSNFHADNFLTRLPEIENRVVLTTNGLDFDLLDHNSENVKKNNKLLLYASRPERGLKLLLEEIWPRLLEVDPELNLALCGYNVDRNNLNPDLIELYGYLDLLIAKSPNVSMLGALNKQDYYQYLAQAALLIYPCIFPEVSCIVALEAQALGTPILTSDSFALTESVVEPQMRVGGRPGSVQYVNDFIERALKMLANPKHLAEMGAKSKKKIRATYGWDYIAKQWERLFKVNLEAKQLKRSIF